MYSAYTLSSLSFNENPDEYYRAGLAQKSGKAAALQRELKKYICEDGSLSATRIQAEWFPSLQADVFLSHSHRDEKMAITLSGYFKKIFGLTTFIDSCVWGYAPDLLEAIDSQYCRNKGESTYNYQKRNLSTGHVHMMLANALTRMIDKTECLIFYATPRSIDVHKSIQMNRTFSPWIFHEIETARTIRQHKERKPQIKENVLHADSSERLSISYDLDFSDFIGLDADDINEWRQLIEKQGGIHALDLLYKKFGLSGRHPK